MSEPTPAASATGKSLEALKEKTRNSLTTVHALLAGGCLAISGLFGGGWVAMAQVRTEAKEVAQQTAATETAGIRTEQAAQKHALKELGEEVADTKAEVRELRKDLRRLFPALPPIQAAKDAGP